MSYKDLKSYQQATVIYDYTVEFCRRFIKNHKIVTQMEGAARDGQVNIVEASENKTSDMIKRNLLGASRFSLGELLGDYENFLRQQGLELWGKDDSRALAVRRIVYGINMGNRNNKNNRDDGDNKNNKNDRPYYSYPTYYSYKTYLDNPETAANCAICLIHQAAYLVDQQLRGVETKSLKNIGTPNPMHQKWKERELARRRKEDEWLKNMQEKINRDNKKDKGK